MIVSSSVSQALAATLAATLDTDLAAAERERFPDGEFRADLVGFDGERAVLVASTVSHDAFVELLQLQDALREGGAERVRTAIPYLGYARQDRAFEPGQPISARAMARAISTGTDEVLVVTPHEESVTEFFDVPCSTVDAAPLLADPLPDLADPVFVAPDDGAIGLAETVRDAYGEGTIDYFEKTRRSGNEIEIEPHETPVENRDVVLVDDIIATGGTMARTAEILADRGADRVVATCVHPVLAGAAYARLVRAGVDGVYGTDTVERPVSAVSAAPAIAEALRGRS